MAVPETCDASQLRVYLRLPGTMTPRAADLPSGLRIDQEQPIAAGAPPCPVLVFERPRGSLRFSVPIEEKQLPLMPSNVNNGVRNRCLRKADATSRSAMDCLKYMKQIYRWQHGITNIRLTAQRNKLEWWCGSFRSAVFCGVLFVLYGGHICKNHRTCF